MSKLYSDKRTESPPRPDCRARIFSENTNHQGVVVSKLNSHSIGALPSLALVLMLGGCALASNGLDYSHQALIRPAPPPAPPAPPPPPPPPAPPCELPAAGGPVTLDGCKTGDSLVLRGVNFASGKSKLGANGKALLDQVASALSAKPEIAVEIGGYTDSTGSAALNKKLSAARAEAVKTYLVSKGIPSAKLTTEGYGPDKPVADNSTPEGRELNRRVELKVAAAGAPTASAAPSTAVAAASSSAAITIANFAFAPDVLKVGTGTAVTWTNKDSAAHVVAFADQSSSDLGTGASYSRTFAAPGEYAYKCGIHGAMTGKVVVN